MERENCGLPWQRDDSSGVVSGTWHFGKNVLLLAAAAVSGINTHTAQGRGFADITPANVGGSGQIAAKVHILSLEIEIYNGADAATLEAVFRGLRSC